MGLSGILGQGLVELVHRLTQTGRELFQALGTAGIGGKIPELGQQGAGGAGLDLQLRIVVQARHVEEPIPAGHHEDTARPQQPGCLAKELIVAVEILDEADGGDGIRDARGQTACEGVPFMQAEAALPRLG